MSINQSAINLLDQLQSVVDQFNRDNYAKPVETLSNSTIGQHVRHTLEFFICLMDSASEQCINYDNRQHDPYLDRDPRLAKDIIHSTQHFLAENTSDFPLTMAANYDIDSDSSVVIPSSFLRELAYNIEHTIHHMALIKVGIKADFPEVILSEHFGVASSTVRFQKSQNA